MKYDIILADPSWTYTDKCTSGERGVFYKYPTMTLEDIKALPVQDVSADNSVLFLWACWPLLQEALDVISAWGFQYKTLGFNWIKQSKTGTRLFWGMGSFSRAGSEICLMGVRGKPRRVSAAVHSSILAPICRHSQKPELIQDRIEQLFGADKNKLELFATRSRDGWTGLGYDIDGRDIRETLPELANS